jgi:hypothetical protein
MSDFGPPDVDDLDESIPPPPTRRRRGNLVGYLANLQAGHEQRVAEAHEGGIGRPTQIDDVFAAVLGVFVGIVIPACLIALGLMVGWIFAGVVAVAGAVWTLYMLFTGRDGPGGMRDWYRFR